MCGEGYMAYRLNNYWLTIDLKAYNNLYAFFIFKIMI